jgi:hypothetical protein
MTNSPAGTKTSIMPSLGEVHVSPADASAGGGATLTVGGMVNVGVGVRV